MTLSFPYALDFLANCLVGDRIPLDLQRFDEMSGSGDGRFWSAAMAQPLWTASYSLYAKQAAHSRELNAKVRALDGAARTFYWADPYYDGPASGVTAGLNSVTVSGIRTDRGAISLSGLPPGFVLSAGDRLTIQYGSGRVYFGEFSEGATAGTLGNIADARELRPYLPFGISVGVTVRLVRPFFKAMVTEFTPFASYRGRWGDSAAITILQKP
ncbi:hypothetical protein [Paracoccus sp. ME4]|uniref:hypothetical protein n=1 Tax=Paracoccus sp. ME4 TaxID=3138066 RepID=UPI00398AF99D